MLFAAPVVVHGTTVAVAPEPVVQVGSTMIKSPGEAASIALWIVPEAATCTGFLPPTVTVTASTDCLPLAAVITNSPHRVDWPGAPWVLGLPYCTCCWMTHAGTLPGTVTTIWVSLQLPTVAAAPVSYTHLTLPTILRV